EQTLGEISRRHESLRTRFTDVGGEGRQVIDPTRAKEGRLAAELLSLVDLSCLIDGDKRRTRDRLAHDEARRPFDLSTPPLWRPILISLETDEHVLLLTMHHIISDEWSLKVLTSEIEHLHAIVRTGMPSRMVELPIQYSDYAVWQREVLQGDVL